MVLLKNEEQVKKNFYKFLKREFKGEIKRDIKIFTGFAPDFLITNKRKKRIVIFRNSPIYPNNLNQEIETSLGKGYAVYIASYVDQTEGSKDLFDDLIEECVSKGLGVIKCEEKNSFKRIKKAKTDYSDEKLDERLVYFFISSKFSLEERDVVYDLVKRLKHQPICVERINLNGKVWDQCKLWLDKSKFFIGIVTKKHSTLVEREINYALSKYNTRCIILINQDCKFCTSLSKETKDFIENKIKPKITFGEYNSIDDLKKEVKKRIPQIINSNIP
jgi:hypothetical protein